MGIIEQQIKRKVRRNEMRRMILASVATVGLLGVAVLAPNVFGAMAKLGILPSRRFGEIVNTSRRRLVQSGHLEYKNGFLRLTAKGESELRQLEISNFVIKKPRRWDLKWRLLIFDIPEYRRPLREKVRRTLTAIGFVRLQDSVWVYPYDCEDLVTLLKADFKIGKDLLYIVADAVENDRRLRSVFGI